MNTVTLAIILIGLCFLFSMNESFEAFANVGSKKFRAKNYKNVQKIKKKLDNEYKKTKCNIKPNPKGNATYEINKGYDCRFYQTGILYNNNALKSWSN
tara:strand:- start:179 stop:472 length:294 start_codon:yes stop_codon:yes gene_type:complete